MSEPHLQFVAHDRRAAPSASTTTGVPAAASTRTLVPLRQSTRIAARSLGTTRAGDLTSGPGLRARATVTGTAAIEQVSSARAEARDAVPTNDLSNWKNAQQDPLWVRLTLIGLAVGSLLLLVIIPVANVFYQALSAGLHAYWDNLFNDPDTRHSIWLTLIVAPTAVGANLVFGVAAAWAIARFRFPGRSALTTLIDLPFAISPVVAGLQLVLLFGLRGYFGPWLREHDIHVIFALPGLILATMFVTLPFIARELIPVLEAIGPDEELAAVSLGARGWQVLWKITLPNIKWGLLYGILLCNARAMGEFGAVYVVSGHIPGQTQTMPLRVDRLFQGYNTPGSFALASLLMLLALVTLVLKTVLERRTQRELAEAAKLHTVEIES
ncbi:MAG: sulfate ABC transporter permease subunit CysW [Pirellulales bacterium]|nr:sulfate ABC transporter permease subunit CysW [Pirellulales bacterium]